MPIPNLRGARRRAVPFLLAVVTGLALTSCSGDKKDEPISKGKEPAEVMDLAKEKLDDTSGVNITLKTKKLPDGITGITDAEGVGTHAPAFDGTITVVLAGSNFEVPVVAVDDKVYAQIPLTTGWSDVDPSEYGAPDPAQLMSTDKGFSSLLPATTDLKEGESVRGGKDNKEVLTEYTGKVPGDVVGNVIPSADGDSFDATYTINSDGELRGAVLTGVFYPDTPEMTYTLGFDDYGTEKEISKP